MHVRITAEPCSQCPWKGRIELSSGRLKELRRDVQEGDGVFICHKKMLEFNGRKDVVSEDEDGPAICRGWMESFPRDWPMELQVAERLGYTCEVRAD